MKIYHTKNYTMLKELELPEPIGNFILSQPDIKGVQGTDGAYYHYTDVCRMLDRYAEQKTSELNGKNLQLQQFNEELRRRRIESDIKQKETSDASLSSFRTNMTVLKAMMEEIKQLTGLLTECEEYLSDNHLQGNKSTDAINTISTGSTLHQKMRDILKVRG